MTTHRPQSVEQFVSMMENFRTARAAAAVEALVARDTDVFISTFAKSGTTWMQQIVHQIRCTTDDTFDDIYQVVPWIESALDMDIDPQAHQHGPFRVFKSHLSYRDLPKGGRYICVLRDPATVVPSWYRFFEGWLFETGKLTLDEFARDFYLPRYNDHAAHYIDAMNRLNQPDTLVLCYEDLIAQPDHVPAMVAAFLNIEHDEETMAAITHRCSRSYMYENRAKFQERLFRRYIDARLNLPAGGESLKVNKTPTSTTLGRDISAELERRWNDNIEPALGFQNYQELRAAIPLQMALAEIA